jgi:putative nucleotidyltransferase with HDIG domain
MNGILTVSLENSTPLNGYFPLENIGGIYDLSRQLVSTNTVETLLESIVRQAVQILEARFCHILTVNPDGTFALQASSYYPAADRTGRKSWLLLAQMQTLYQRALLSQAPAIIVNSSVLADRLRAGLKLDENNSLFLVPLRVNQEALGLLLLGEDNWPPPEPEFNEKIRLAVMVADQAASALGRARLSNQLEENQVQTVLALAKVMESRDAYVANHSRKVTALSVRLARRLECSPGEEQSIRWAALLHDIGKVGIPDEVLNKGGPLNESEWQMMRNHPKSGAEIVRQAANLNYVASLILSHHERFDGKGYPYGLQRELIPLGARILAVADAYSAMTDDRPYRASSPNDQALHELSRCAGTQFDPRVVDAFLTLFC